VRLTRSDRRKGRAHRAQVGGDVLADAPVAAGGAQREKTFDEGDFDANAVDLGFDHEGGLVAMEPFDDPVLKRRKLVGAVGVVEGQHGHVPHHLGEHRQGRRGHPLGG